MKVNFLKIIIFSFVIFFLLIFWLGLKKDNSYNTNPNHLKNMFDGNYSTSCRIRNGGQQGFFQQPISDRGFDLLIDVGRKFKPRQFTITSQLNSRFTYQLCFMNEVKTGADGGGGFSQTTARARAVMGKQQSVCHA